MPLRVEGLRKRHALLEPLDDLAPLRRLGEDRPGLDEGGRRGLEGRAPGGGVLLGLMLLGLVSLGRSAVSKVASDKKRTLVIFIGAFIAEFVFMLATTNVAFQRYYMVLIPLVVLASSVGINNLAAKIPLPGRKTPGEGDY